MATSGREAIQTRVDFALGAVAPWRSHPDEELVYVAQGTLQFQIQGQEPVTLKTGDTYHTTAGAVHMERNCEANRSVELATYIVEKGKRLLVRFADPSAH